MAKFKTVIEIGTYKTRMVTLDSISADKVCLKSCSELKTPSDYVVSTNFEQSIIDKSSIKANISSLIKEVQPNNKNVMMVLSDHFAITNLILLPSDQTLKDKETTIKEYFVGKMKLPYENWLVSNNVICKKDNDEITYVSAVLKKNLLEIGGLLQKTGLCPIVIDTNFFNVANLIENYLVKDDNKNKNICLIHLGHQSTSLGILKEGLIKVIHNVSIGGQDLTKQISRHFHISEKEADAFKQKADFFLQEYSDEQESFYNYTIIKSLIDNLCAEMLKTFDNYFADFNESKIDEIIISGGGANFKNIDVLLKEKLKAPVKRICELYNLEINNEALNDDRKNSLATVCGCFMRD